jgi:ketosteroid isomerase-like protein
MHSTSKAVSNLEIVRCFYDGLDGGDLNPLDYFSASMTWYVSDFLPWGGTTHGMESNLAMLRAMRAKLTGAFEPDEIFEAGSEIIAIGRFVGFLNDTQETCCVPTVHVWRFSEGRAVSLACYSASDSPFSKLS